MMTKFHFLEIAFTGCKTLCLRLSTLLSSCQTTKLYLCLMGIKQLVLRILHLQRGKRQPKEAVYMCPLVVDLIALLDVLTSSWGAAKAPTVLTGGFRISLGLHCGHRPDHACWTCGASRQYSHALVPRGFMHVTVEIN